MHNEKGFTLIELVMVIVILGILTAVAVPKFIDLRTEANAAALQGVVGAIASASAVNYAGRSANSAKGAATADGTLTCHTAADVILQGGLPSGYTLNTDVTVVGVNSCTVTQTATSESANVIIIGIN